jgi:hypothetical protein
MIFQFFLFLKSAIYDHFCTLAGLVLLWAVPPGHILLPRHSLGGPLPPQKGGQYEGDVAPKLPYIRVMTEAVFSTGVGTE